MIFPIILLSVFITKSCSQLCQQCGNYNRRMMSYGNYGQQKNYNFNFEKFFSQFPGFSAPQQSPPSTFSSSPSASSSSRILNVYGQDAEAFGSAIGKSIGQRIQQHYSQQDPTIQFTPPESPPSTYASLSPTSSAPSSYPTTSYGTSTYQTSPSTSSWPSTHPPEDLPTVQQAYQSQQRYGSTPSIPQSLTQNSNGFGGLPGLLPPPQNSDCPWCSQNGYRGKRMKAKKEEEKKKNEKI